MRYLTWIQASGKLHIWNYFWTMKQMVDAQNSLKKWDDVFVMIVDMHSITSLNKKWDAEILRENVKNAILDHLAIWIDPEKVVFYVQSDIPEVAELYWYLSSITWMWMLNQWHSYKDKIAKWIPASHALFSYPVLMAADILIINAEIIPVWKDQMQHVEMARDIAQKFNNTYWEVFKIPEYQIKEDVKTVPWTDWEKMSKSYWNTIPLFWTEKEIKKKIMSIETASTPLEEPMDFENCNVMAIYKLFANKEKITILEEKYKAWWYWFWSAKKDLFEEVKNYFWPIWEKRIELEKEEWLVEKVRKIWEEKMRNTAIKILEKVRKKVGVR